MYYFYIQRYNTIMFSYKVAVGLGFNETV